MHLGNLICCGPSCEGVCSVDFQTLVFQCHFRLWGQAHFLTSQAKTSIMWGSLLLVGPVGFGIRCCFFFCFLSTVGCLQYGGRYLSGPSPIPFLSFSLPFWQWKTMQHLLCKMGMGLHKMDQGSWTRLKQTIWGK